MPDVNTTFFETTQCRTVSGLDDGKRKTKRGWSPGDSLNLVRVLSVRVNYSQQCRNDINGRWEYSKSIRGVFFVQNPRKGSKCVCVCGGGGGGGGAAGLGFTYTRAHTRTHRRKLRQYHESQNFPRVIKCVLHHVKYFCKRHDKQYNNKFIINRTR